MENIIYNELLYRGYSVDVGVVSVRLMENDSHISKKLEIDFIANKGSRRYYLQSAFAIPDQEKMNQEQESLVRVSDSFKKIIITSTNSPLWRNEQGITIMSIYDFLLHDNSLELCFAEPKPPCSLHAGMLPYRTPLTGCGICVRIVPSFIIKPRRATARMWNFKVDPITFRHRTDS